MAEKKCVMICSTARDLPEHRKEVMDACLRQGMFPDMMEHLPASDADAIRVSLEMVERADIYLGVFAHRYGYVPKENNPKNISITEMEYDRAVERNIPRLIFIMHEDHSLKAADVETGEGAEKLKKLKERIGIERVAGFFKSPDDLRGLVIQALVPYREADITQFHYISDIPAPPEAYIAHPYTLLQTHRLVGRQDELNLFTNWVTAGRDSQPSALTDVHIMNIVAIGGMGKSALTWKWFNDIAPQEMKPLAGRMWWSFYESDASFENFVIRALAYVTKRTHEDVQKISPPEREAQLLAALDRGPFLFVLDGLERILLAYARMDAARLADDDIDQRTANYGVKTFGSPENGAQAFVGQHLLRKTADPRAGSFLRKLANVRATRILVSTRLYPADLQAVAGEPIHGCSAIVLSGLQSLDALKLWHSLGVGGKGHLLLPIFDKFENHPLLIQILAGAVANYRRAPGNFERWQKDHPNFNPFALLVNVPTHVLEYALRGLDDKVRKVLETIATFRMPASYDTLAALFVGNFHPGPLPKKIEAKLFLTELELDVALKELEDRGLLGWDKRANRYDLHPIVRGVVWGQLTGYGRREIYKKMYTYFKSLPAIDQDKVERLEDMTAAIELYNTLIGLGRYNNAWHFFDTNIGKAIWHHLSASQEQVELLSLLTDVEKMPRLNSSSAQVALLDSLAHAYYLTGHPGGSVPYYRQAARLLEQVANEKNPSTNLSLLCHFSAALKTSGVLYEAENVARRVLRIAQERRNPLEQALSLRYIGVTFAVRSINSNADQALQRSLRLFASLSQSQSEGAAYGYLAERALWLGDTIAARSMANRAWEMALVERHQRDFIRAARIQGVAALSLSDLTTADERLYYSLAKAREVKFVEEEILSLVGLAELLRRQGDLKTARDLLDDVWELAERGPYPLYHADAFNVLAQIEQDAGNLTAAVEAATNAYRLAWCDGEPYAYHWGLVAARKHLKELGAPEPEMPPFDESKFEPMQEVDINPNDEFHVDENEIEKWYGMRRTFIYGL